MISNLFNNNNKVINDFINALKNPTKPVHIDEATLIAARILKECPPKDFSDLYEYNKWQLAVLIVEKADGISYPLYISSPKTVALSIVSIATGIFAFAIYGTMHLLN